VSAKQQCWMISQACPLSNMGDWLATVCYMISQACLLSNSAGSLAKRVRLATVPYD